MNNEVNCEGYEGYQQVHFRACIWHLPIRTGGNQGDSRVSSGWKSRELHPDSKAGLLNVHRSMCVQHCTTAVAWRSVSSRSYIRQQQCECVWRLCAGVCGRALAHGPGCVGVRVCGVVCVCVCVCVCLCYCVLYEYKYSHWTSLRGPLHYVLKDNVPRKCHTRES